MCHWKEHLPQRILFMLSPGLLVDEVKCERQSHLQLTCLESQVLNIEHANYGREQSDVCRLPPGSNQDDQTLCVSGKKTVLALSLKITCNDHNDGYNIISYC